MGPLRSLPKSEEFNALLNVRLYQIHIHPAKCKGLHANMFRQIYVILLEAVQTRKHSYTHL